MSQIYLLYTILSGVDYFEDFIFFLENQTHSFAFLTLLLSPQQPVSMKVKVTVKGAQSCLTLWSHGLYCLWSSPGQNVEVHSLSLLQGIFPTQGSNTGFPHCRQILYQLSHKEGQEYWSGEPIPSPEDLPNPGIKLGSPALQAILYQPSCKGSPYSWYG